MVIRLWSPSIDTKFRPGVALRLVDYFQMGELHLHAYHKRSKEVVVGIWQFGTSIKQTKVESADYKLVYGEGFVFKF